MSYLFALMFLACDCVSGMMGTTEVQHSDSATTVSAFKYDGGKEVDKAMVSAIIEGNYDTVCSLVDDRNIHAVDSNGNTLLHLAVKKFTGRERVINLLLKSGVNVNAKNNEGHTPLYEACLLKNLFVVKLLLTRGADVVPNVVAYAKKNWPAGLEILDEYRIGDEYQVKSSDGETNLLNYDAGGSDEEYAYDEICRSEVEEIIKVSVAARGCGSLKQTYSPKLYRKKYKKTRNSLTNMYDAFGD